MWHIIIFQVLQMISKWNINSILNLTNIRRHFEIWEKKLRKKWDSKKFTTKIEIRKKIRKKKRFEKNLRKKWVSKKIWQINETDEKRVPKQLKKKIYGKMIVKLNRGTDSLNCIKWVWRIIIKTREKERKINAKKMKLIQ